MKRVLFAVLALPPWGAAVAQERTDGASYDYFGIGYSRLEIEDDLFADSFDFVAYGIEGSIAFRDHVHLFGTAAVGRDDEPGVTIDTLDLVAGVGTHWEPLERFSVHGRVGFVDSRIDVEDTGDELDDDGYYLAAGVRYMPADWVELRTGVTHVDFDDVGSDTSPTIGADLYLTDVVALTLDYVRHEDDANTLTIGARFYPGKDVLRGRR